MKQLEKPIGKPLKECKCLNEFITSFLKRFLNDQRLNRDNFINNQVVTINGKKYKPKGIDHEAQDEAITKLWYEYKHGLYEGILSIGHHPDCDLVLDVERRLKDDQYAISNKISKMEKECFVEEISERRREIFSLLNGSVFDVMKVKAFYKTIYYYTRLIELFNGDSKNDTTYSNGQNIQINEFKDIIDVKYHPIIPSLFNLLGHYFPEHYDHEGKAYNNRRNIKAILNSWYKLLKAESFIVINPTKEQKKQICNVLLAKCGFIDSKLSTKTLFDNDGIDTNLDLGKKYIELKKAIKDLKIK